MRLWHLFLAVFGTALIFSIARDPTGRVAIVVFFCGLAEVVVGLAGVMTLFQTIGALGEAEGVVAHIQALIATALVTAITALLMLSIFYVCIVVVSRVVL